MVGIPGLFVSHQRRKYISPALFILLALHKDGIIKQLWKYAKERKWIYGQKVQPSLFHLPCLFRFCVFFFLVLVIELAVVLSFQQALTPLSSLHLHGLVIQMSSLPIFAGPSLSAPPRGLTSCPPALACSRQLDDCF